MSVGAPRLVGTAVTAVQNRGANLEGLSAATQNDARPDTRFGDVRCGAGVTVAAAVLRGPAGVRHLLDGLAPAAKGDVRREAVISDARAEAARGRVSLGTIQRLQDLLYEVGSNDGVPGTSSTEQDAQVRMAGLPTRPIADRYPAIVESDKPPASWEEHVRALETRATLWRTRLDATLQPGEAVPLVTSNGPSAQMTHVVLAGRNRDGSLYIYDSGRVPGLLSSANADHRAAIEGILGRALSFHGSSVIRVAG